MKIELLCPAGDLERLKTAVIFGADAVYAGLPDFSLRNPREITFTPKTLKTGIDFVHNHGKKIYLTFNIFPHEKDIRKLEKNIKGYFRILKDIDGIIVSDLGVFSLIKKYFPKTPIHISTQANNLNSETIKMWEKLGAKRVVLARELTLKEIEEIKRKLQAESRPSTSGKSPTLKVGTSSVELEAFGHGAMCIAYSGRCLLSKYYTGREANLGDCAQSCRWKYKIKSCRDTARRVSTGQYYIEEELRLNDLVEVQEDPRGTYFLNSKEICTIDILNKFIESGIDTLKIEGRAKSIYYLACVTRVYRKAINKYYELSSKQVSCKHASKNVGAYCMRPKQEWKKLIKELTLELNLVSNRGYSHGFLLGKDDYEQNYETTAIKPPIIFLGVILGKLKTKNLKRKTKVLLRDNIYLVEVKNKFKAGDKIEIITPDEIYKCKIKEIFDQKNNEIEEALTPQDKVWVTLSVAEEVEIIKGSIIRKRIK